MSANIQDQYIFINNLFNISSTAHEKCSNILLGLIFIFQNHPLSSLRNTMRMSASAGLAVVDHPTQLIPILDFYLFNNTQVHTSTYNSTKYKYKCQAICWAGRRLKLESTLALSCNLFLKATTLLNSPTYSNYINGSIPAQVIKSDNFSSIWFNYTIK